MEGHLFCRSFGGNGMIRWEEDGYYETIPLIPSSSHTSNYSVCLLLLPPSPLPPARVSKNAGMFSFIAKDSQGSMTPGAESVQFQEMGCRRNGHAVKD